MPRLNNMRTSAKYVQTFEISILISLNCRSIYCALLRRGRKTTFMFFYFEELLREMTCIAIMSESYRFERVSYFTLYFMFVLINSRAVAGRVDT